MFPAGFRALGLGKVVGTPTRGAVIGTGSYSLIDGSTIRTPGVGVFLADEGRTNMENSGVKPDVFVENTPEDNLAGRLNRTRSDTGRSKLQERLEAARQEHQIRRIDQIKRHEIGVYAHVDALLVVAEPAYRTRVRYVNERHEQQRNALWIPRRRSWTVEDVSSPEG